MFLLWEREGGGTSHIHVHKESYKDVCVSACVRACMHAFMHTCVCFLEEEQGDGEHPICTGTRSYKDLNLKMLTSESKPLPHEPLSYQEI